MILPMCMYLARNLGGRGGGPARGAARARSSKGSAGGGSDSLAMDGVMSSRSRSRRGVTMPKQKFSAMFWSRGLPHHVIGSITAILTTSVIMSWYRHQQGRPLSRG